MGDGVVSSVSNTTASTSSGSSDTAMSPSSASPTQNTVAVECRWWHAHFRITSFCSALPPPSHRLRPLGQLWGHDGKKHTKERSSRSAWARLMQWLTGGECHHLTLAPPLHLWADFLFEERPKNQPSVQPSQSTSSFPYVLISSLLPPVRLLVSVMWRVVFGVTGPEKVPFMVERSTGSRFLQQHSSVCKFILFFFVNSNFLEKQKRLKKFPAVSVFGLFIRNQSFYFGKNKQKIQKVWCHSEKMEYLFKWIFCFFCKIIKMKLIYSVKILCVCVCVLPDEWS